MEGTFGNKASMTSTAYLEKSIDSKKLCFRAVVSFFNSFSCSRLNAEASEGMSESLETLRVEGGWAALSSRSERVGSGGGGGDDDAGRCASNTGFSTTVFQIR